MFLYCPNCGKKQNSKFIFCPACGCKLPNKIGADKNHNNIIIPDVILDEEYAGFFKRAAAFSIDQILLVIIYIIGGLLLTPLTTTKAGADLLYSLMTILISWLYHATLESSLSQATLGKMAVGIIVTDLWGNPISFGKATGRHFGKIVSSVIFGIGYLMIFFTQKKQCLHDIMAGCLVLNKY